ncbi:MAG: DUF4381 domain-containing protein [Gammaproteobacteria bacterium]
MNPDIVSLPLRDIHMPDTVYWWPLAIGWWILLGLLVAIVAITYIYKYLKKRKLDSPLGQCLITGPYQKHVSLGQQEIQQLVALCQQWIQTVARQAHPQPAAGEH